MLNVTPSVAEFVRVRTVRKSLWGTVIARYFAQPYQSERQSSNPRYTKRALREYSPHLTSLAFILMLKWAKYCKQ